MKTSKYSDSLIMSILKQAEAGTPVPHLCREHGMNSATFFSGGLLDDANLAEQCSSWGQTITQLSIYFEGRLDGIIKI